MTRVLVTGATGFIGTVVCEQLARSGYVVRAALRAERSLPSGVAEGVTIGDLGPDTLWVEPLKDVDLVVHAAARAHILRDVPGAARFYAQTNVQGTRQLARAAEAAGVRRFIYLSSIKVNGEETSGRPYGAEDVPEPRDAYATSKLAGELALRQCAEKGGMEFAVVRPPLVYGSGVQANFLRLMHWVDQERVLPFAGIANQRSLVSVWNLVDLITCLLEHPRAAGRVWMVSDGEDLSTPDLIERLAHALGRRARMLSIPPAILRLAGALSGRRAEIHRLCSSLTVDASPARELLSWSAPLGVDEGLARTAGWYRSRPQP